jgi:serine/threonine protein kinase
MTPKNWQQVEHLLEEALKRTPEERTAFLETACAGDEELREEVEAGLAKQGLSGNLTETVPMGPTVKEQAHRHTTSLLGRKLGPYEILAWLGKGGMGEVYKVQDSRLDRIDALKILPAEVASNPERLKRFVREAKAASALNHPNIATIYEIGEAEGFHYIAMEFVEGHTLADQLRSRRLEMAEILDIGIQVAEALETASKKGIIHRDIKPANIMLTSEGRVKVLDFGLAKITKLQGQAVNTITQTESGAIMGTLQYMSPEQMLGQEIDHRTDIFSLGVVLFEMTTGRRPFPASDTTQLIATILTQQPKRPSELNPSIPAALENVILKALEKKPEQRYSSAHELRVELERLRLPSPVMADLSPSRLLRHYFLTPARRHPRGLTLSAGLLIIALTIVFWLFRTESAISFAPRDWVVITDLDNQTGDPLFDKGLMTAFVTSLEQSTHVNIVPRIRLQATLRRMGKTEGERIDETIGREICLRDNIKGVIACGLANIGQKYVFSARIVDPQTGDTVRSYLEKTATQEQLLTALDTIAGKVRRDLGESYFSIRRSGRPLPLVTTSSLQALKLFTDGFYLFSRGKYGEGMELYRQALQHDPDFAMVHASLGFAYFSHLFNDPPKGKAEFEKALKNSDRLTDRERLYLQASYKGQLGYLDEAVQLHNVYLRTYPDDTITRFSFGSLLMHNRRFQEAIDQFKEVIRVVPKDANTYIQLATTYS